MAKRTNGAEEGLNKKKDGEIGRFNAAQFKTIEAVPFDYSPALNLIGVHPALIALAKAAVKTDDVHLYQCQAWAKFTGDPFWTETTLAQAQVRYPVWDLTPYRAALAG